MRIACYRLYARLKYYCLRVLPIHTHGVLCLVYFEDKILFVQHRYDDGHWQLPGGSRWPKASPRRAIVKELEHELGLKAAFDQPRWIGSFEVIIPGHRKPRSIDLYLYEIKTRDHQPRRHNTTEIDSIEFYPRQSPPEGIQEGARMALDLLQEYFDERRSQPVLRAAS